MNSGPICAMVWEGRDAVKTGRSTSPLCPPHRRRKSANKPQLFSVPPTHWHLPQAPSAVRHPQNSTLRHLPQQLTSRAGDYAIDVGRNVCHGSDSVENAKKEIALWFKPEEVISWTSAQAAWVYEK